MNTRNDDDAMDTEPAHRLRRAADDPMVKACIDL